MCIRDRPYAFAVIGGMASGGGRLDGDLDGDGASDCDTGSLAWSAQLRGSADKFVDVDATPVLDGTLVPKGERVEWYVAIAGHEKSSRGFALVQCKAPDAAAASRAV